MWYEGGGEGRTTKKITFLRVEKKFTLNTWFFALYKIVKNIRWSLRLCCARMKENWSEKIFRFVTAISELPLYKDNNFSALDIPNGLTLLTLNTLLTINLIAYNKPHSSQPSPLGHC